jgi:ABC-type multidrug transport system fused ATPase/permease subunit
VYVDRIAWVAGEGFRLYWPRILGVTALNAFGVLATAAAFLGVAAFARHLETGGDPVRILGLELAVSNDAKVLARSIAGLAALGVVGALSMYAAEWQIARLAAAYQRHCSERILMVGAEPKYAGWPALVDDAPRFALQRLNSEARITAYALRNLLRAILPIIIFLVAAAALVAVDAELTALLAPLLVVYLVPLYLINRGVARQQRAYREAAPAAKRLLGEGMRLLDSESPSTEKIAWAARSWEAPEHDHAAQLFWRRRLASQRVKTLNLIFFTICLLGLFGYFLVETSAGERAWSDFIVFVVALRFVFFGVKQMTSRFVKLSRFLSEFRAYTEFVDGAERLRAENERGGVAPLPDSLIFRCGKDGRWQSAPRLRVERRQSAIILTPHRVTHGMLQAAAARIALSLREPADLLSRSNLAAQRGDAAEATVECEFHSSLVTRHSSTYSFIVLDDAADALRLIEQSDNCAGVMVLEDRALIGCGEGEWLRAHLDEIDEFLRGARAVEGVDEEVDLDDDEDEEEE